ncbi:hypothetical protein [Streptomyces sp. 11x1]|uniref:hypothetical protein n=1 Tax=Streptomyces sp. 11x1 TaxID=3038642 RepID=UPI00292F6E39|nr:hypothetical protein [Streptomyces sp. 11x1]WNZ08700.1 hypothetical protein P8T65_14645 [Streptomyces sp. 11x1]
MVSFRRKKKEEDLSQISTGQLTLEFVDVPVTAEDVEWDRRATEARFNSLTAIQATAERWGATILVITGLLTALTVIRGPSDVNALQSTASKVTVGVLSALSLFTALGSVVYAARAAQGQAVRVLPTGDRFRQATLLGTETANKYLTRSRVLALWIIPFYLASIAVMSYAPQKEAGKPVVSVTDAAGVNYCGSVKISKGVFIVTSERGVVNRVPSSSVRAVAAKKECKK